jgi:fatty acid desaturase
MLSPSRNVVLALASYVMLALAATFALGDLGDVGFWVVWIPLVAIVLYLTMAGVRAGHRSLRTRTRSSASARSS